MDKNTSTVEIFHAEAIYRSSNYWIIVKYGDLNVQRRITYFYIKVNDQR